MWPKIICGVLPFGHKIGRYTDIAEEIRFCRICNTGAVETEELFLTVCPKLNNIRDAYATKFETQGIMSIEDNIEKIRCMLGKQNLNMFCDVLQDLIEERNALIYRIVEHDDS